MCYLLACRYICFCLWSRFIKTGQSIFDVINSNWGATYFLFEFDLDQTEDDIPFLEMGRKILTKSIRVVKLSHFQIYYLMPCWLIGSIFYRNAAPRRRDRFSPRESLESAEPGPMLWVDMFYTHVAYRLVLFSDVAPLTRAFAALLRLNINFSFRSATLGLVGMIVGKHLRI